MNFKFNVSEKLPGVWITATVSWDGGSAQMTCNQEGDIVTCSGPKSAADKNIKVTFLGISYSTYVNSRPLFSPSYCYSVYDWPLDASTAWVDYGTYCQDSPANYGDMIDWYNPDWDEILPYEFLPESPTPCMFDPVYGDAYYFPGCPL